MVFSALDMVFCIFYVSTNNQGLVIVVSHKIKPKYHLSSVFFLNPLNKGTIYGLSRCVQTPTDTEQGFHLGLVHFKKSDDDLYLQLPAVVVFKPGQGL